MSDPVAVPHPERIRVGVADMAVGTDHRPLVTSGLGSCVAVAIHDDEGIGGLLHAMLPAAPVTNPTPAKYVDSGVTALLDALESAGGQPRSFVAKLAGGSSMLDIGNGSPIGDQNVAAAVAALEAAGVDLLAQDTGGDAGRSVSFHPPTGTMTIKRVHDETTEL